MNKNDVDALTNKLELSADTNTDVRLSAAESEWLVEVITKYFIWVDRKEEAFK